MGVGGVQIETGSSPRVGHNDDSLFREACSTHSSPQDMEEGGGGGEKPRRGKEAAVLDALRLKEHRGLSVCVCPYAAGCGASLWHRRRESGFGQRGEGEGGGVEPLPAAARICEFMGERPRVRYGVRTQG